MNLYLFNDNDSAAEYGIGTYLKELTKAIDESAINVHIIQLHSIRSEFEIVKTDNVEYWNIPEVRNENTFSGSMQKVEGYYLNVICLLRLYIKDTKNLVFHFNYNHCQFIAKELKAIFDCKTVSTVHFTKWMLEFNSNFSLLNRIKAKPEKQRSRYEQLIFTTDELENLLFKSTDRVIALSRYMHNLLQTEYQLDPHKIITIPNGLEDISTQMKISKNESRRKWRISEKELLVLFTGRLHPVKGLNFLIKAFRKVLEEMPDCRLMIAGSGEFNYYMKECEDIWTHVSWTGKLSKDKLYELYSISDIGVMPSFHEQCSYVAIEMMMHGLPIIGSTSTGLKEMIADGETGLHIPVIEYDNKVEIDTSLLAEKMLYLLNNSDVRQYMRQNARKRYEEQYSKEVFRKNMLAFYNSL